MQRSAAPSSGRDYSIMQRAPALRNANAIRAAA